MAVLLEVPVDDGATLLVEADRTDLAEQIPLATTPGRAVARASHDLSESLDGLQPLLRALREKLAGAGPETFTVEFGVKIGGETGIIIAKGTAEVNLTITMTWNRAARPAP